VALLTDLDSDNGDSNDKVTLMTIHSAKGLEFPTVFVVGLEENIFPSPMSINSIRELEEERRLLYVAITRAEKHCILTCAQNRWRYGRMEYDTPSRFIRDIDPGLLDTQSEKGGDVLPFGGSRSSGWMQNPRPVATQFKADPKPRAVAPRQPEKPVDPFGPNFKRVYNAVAPRKMATEPSAADLHEGSTIEHQRCGVGEVVRIEGTGENTKATVQFRHAGTKQLLLKFAKFKILG
jgi:DNA helicase-2/ATP-dependent DNA helicase PcrA